MATIMYIQSIMLAISLYLLVYSEVLTRQPMTLSEWAQLRERGLKDRPGPLHAAILAAFFFALGGSACFFA